MKNIYRKYIDNKLTRNELSELRGSSGLQSDNDLIEALQEEWASDDYLNVSDEVMYRVKSKLDNEIHDERRRIPIYYKAIGWAAGILLPLFILSTFYLYRENNQLTSEEMIVSTAQGEKATITLPDGTLVTLNSDSKLAYTPKVYNKDSRQIHFSGEGYFVISKDKDRPFLIDAKGLKVEVIGTTFNLSVRERAKSAELFLESGKVMFTSLLRQESVMLKPNQKLIMNQATGKMVLKDESIKDAGAWRKNEMIFRNAPLHAVLAGIETIYNVRIKVNSAGVAPDAFTGTLVTNDLNGVLEVLERTYNLKATMANGEISMVKFK